MAYTFDAASGATRDQLVELVIANTFSPGRFTEPVRGWLNDAVTDICRRLRIQRGFDILDHDAAGVVAQPTRPYFHIEELWTAGSGVPTTGEQAYVQRRQFRLEPLPEGHERAIGSVPVFYSARRVAATSRYPQLQITVLPARAVGKVAIVGLQRPAVMAQSTDPTGLGADLDRAVVAYAKARCFEMEDDFDMADRWELRQEAALRAVTQLDDDSDGPKVTPGTWGPLDG